MRYLTRLAERRVKELTQRHPVMVLTGARQTGKTTLLKNLFPAPEWRYVTLDDLDVLEAATQRPQDVLGLGKKLILDEAQRAPALMHAVKQAVDEDREGRRILLSGSANLSLMKGVSESLAGRAVHLSLSPMTSGETLGISPQGLWEHLFDPQFVRELTEWAFASPVPADVGIVPLKADLPAGFAPFAEDLADGGLGEQVWRGGFPALLGMADVGVTEWFEGYERTYLERDVMLLTGLSDLVPFRRLLRTVSLQIGGLANLASLSRDTGISAPTVRRYLDLLELSMILSVLPSYHTSQRKRVIKTPKLYLADTGLEAFLASSPSIPELSSRREWPFWVENWVFLQLAPRMACMQPRGEVLFWRSTDNYEVDFVLEWKDRIVGIEVKTSTTIGSGMSKGLITLREQAPEKFTAGVVLYAGDHFQTLGDRLLAVPLSCLAL